MGETGERSLGKTRPPARVYEPGEFSRVLEKLVESRLGSYSTTGLELEGLLGEIGRSTGCSWTCT